MAGMGRHAPLGMRLLGWAAIYVGFGLLGRATVIDGEALSLVGPAGGVAVLWLASGDRRTLPWDTATLGTVVFLLNVLSGLPVLMALVFVVGTFGQVSLFLWLWGWSARTERVLRVTSLGDLSRLVVASVLASLLGATLGHVGRRLVMDAGDPATLAVWWGRNAAGILLVTVVGSLLLERARTGTGLQPAGARRFEFIAILAGSLLLYVVVFTAGETHPLAFLLLFATLLAGARLTPLGVAVHTVFTGALVIVLTLQELGPFAAVQSLPGRALVAQVFVVTVLLTGLVLAFSHQQRDRALADLEAARRSDADRATLLAAILENLREGVSVVRDDGQVVVRNPAGRRLLGAGAADLPNTVQGAEAYGLRHPDGAPLADAERPHVRALSGDPVLAEDLLVRNRAVPQGRVLEVTAVPMRGQRPDDRRLAVVTFRDVTTDREDRQHLASFAGVVAHDLSNPLTIVAGWSESLAEAFSEGAVEPEDGGPMIARIQLAAAHMRQFIDDLLDYTVARDHPIQVADFDLSAVAESVAALRRDADTRPEIDIEAGIWVRGDSALVRQLLDNLIGNAVKYVAPGVRPRITVTAEDRDGEREIQVTDNGIGIPEDDREQVFDDFHRAHPDSYRGTGIGLAICRRVIERHGGRIRAEANPTGTGTRFVFTLPTSDVELSGAVGSGSSSHETSR